MQDQLQNAIDVLRSNSIGLAKFIGTEGFYFVMKQKESSTSSPNLCLVRIGNLGGVSTTYISRDYDRLVVRFIPDNYTSLLDLIEDVHAFDAFVKSF